MRLDKSFLFVFVISIFPLLNLLTPGLLVSHDAWLHGGRIASFYQSLSDGIVIPRWAGNLNLGFGNPIHMFVYPLPSYVGSFFHFLGLGISDSIKTMLAASYILSGIIMYIWIKEFLGKNAAVVASVLYLFAPYRFIDLYVRGALGEHIAFLFMPLVCLSILKINNLKKINFRKLLAGSIAVSFSFAFLILSHNTISLIFIPFIIFYTLFLFYQNRSKRNLLLTVFSLSYGTLLSSFFWFPAFFEGKYTLRDIVTAGEYAKHFVNPPTLIYSPWTFGGSTFFSNQLGIAHILLFTTSLFVFKKMLNKNNKEKLLYIGTVIILFTSIFLMLKESNFIWQILTTLPKIQFPWRFLAITVFCLSLIGGLVVSKINNRLILFLIIIFTIAPTIAYWHAKDYDTSFNDAYFKNEFRGTTDTGEVSPIWSIRFMEKEAIAPIEIIDGKAAVVTSERKSNYHNYVIKNDEKIRVKENTLYFPGWKVYDNGNLISDVEFQDPKNRGLITFYLEKGMHNIEIKFEDTKLRKFANYVTFISLIPILISLFYLALTLRIKLR